MPVRHFADKLIAGLKQEATPPTMKHEKDFERGFVFPLALYLAEAEGDVWLFRRPWGDEEKCKPDCQAAMTSKRQRVLGCPDCWKESQKWASVSAFGIHYEFDLVARGRRGTTLAVQIKSVKEENGGLQIDQIERFLGQCVLAASRHDVVIGVCGLWRSPNSVRMQETKTVRRWAERHGIHLVFRELV